MHILLANDDGYQAPGLLVLSEALKQQHHAVTIVAPRHDVSGSGMGLSLRKKVKVTQHEPNFFIVDGTPADCIYLGFNNLVFHSSRFSNKRDQQWTEFSRRYSVFGNFRRRYGGPAYANTRHINVDHRTQC